MNETISSNQLQAAELAYFKIRAAFVRQCGDMLTKAFIAKHYNGPERLRYLRENGYDDQLDATLGKWLWLFETILDHVLDANGDPQTLPNALAYRYNWYRESQIMRKRIPIDGPEKPKRVPTDFDLEDELAVVQARQQIVNEIERLPSWPAGGYDVLKTIFTDTLATVENSWKENDAKIMTVALLKDAIADC